MSYLTSNSLTLNLTACSELGRVESHPHLALHVLKPIWEGGHSLYTWLEYSTVHQLLCYLDMGLVWVCPWQGRHLAQAWRVDVGSGSAWPRGKLVLLCSTVIPVLHPADTWEHLCRRCCTGICSCKDTWISGLCSVFINCWFTKWSFFTQFNRLQYSLSTTYCIY